MRVALVNPSIGAADRRRSKPIGLAYIGSYLREHGIAAEGFDFGDAMTDADTLVRKYELDSFDVVGFSTYNESFGPGVELADIVKAKNPGATVVFGGPHSTAIHDAAVVRHPSIDYVVRGEGEVTFLRLLEQLRQGRRPLLSPGITHAVDGKAVVGPDAAPLEDLDRLPFPSFEFASETPYPQMTYWNETRQELVPALAINTSRSCPYNCSFCGVLTIGRKYRERSPESVVEELAHFTKRDQTRYLHVYFSDANFFVKPQRALAIFERLHEAEPELTLSFGTRVNQILRAGDSLERMRELGVRFVELGIESNSKPVLKRLAKGVTPEMNAAAIRLLARHGIDISLDFIMFDPATTRDDLQANIDFLNDNGLYDFVPHDHLYTKLVLYAGTPIRDWYAAQFGLTFEPEALPRTEDLFVEPDIARIDRQLTWFRYERQPGVDQLLSRLELACELLRLDYPASRDRLGQAQLDAVALRNVPILFLEELVARDDLADDRLPGVVDELLADLGGWAPLTERVTGLADELAIPTDVLPMRHINGRIL